MQYWSGGQARVAPWLGARVPGRGAERRHEQVAGDPGRRAGRHPGVRAGERVQRHAPVVRDDRRHPEAERLTGGQERHEAGDQHYDLISALHKSLRGSDPDASLYWLARMIEGGEDPLFIARRMVRMAVEDIGLADPQAMTVCRETYPPTRDFGTGGNPHRVDCHL